MIIPNDDFSDYRVRKFIEYQRAVPPVHQKVLLQYAIDYETPKDDLIFIAWLMANTYHEITTLFLYETSKTENLIDFYARYRDKIQFGSAKKYITMNNRFIPILSFFYDHFRNEPYQYLKKIMGQGNQPNERYDKIIRFSQTCKNVGRFSADLFNEILMVYQKGGLLDLGIKESTEFDWEHSANLTSAVLNLMYEDELADRWDRGEISKAELSELKPRLTQFLLQLKEKIQHTYEEETDIPLFITKLCSFRNLFKNNRYGGFHHDRQLQYLKQYEIDFPNETNLWNKIYKIRERVFLPNLLGEKNNWVGIRKERKKLWTTKGLTGVEV